MYIEIFIATIAVGIFVGLIGIGGGILLFPILIFFGFTIQQTVAISLFLNVIPNALPAFYMYYTTGAFKWKPAILITVASMIGIMIGGYIGAKRLVSDLTIYRTYTALLFSIGFYALFYQCGLKLPF